MFNSLIQTHFLYKQLIFRMIKKIVFIIFTFQILTCFGQKEHLIPVTFNNENNLNIYFSNLNKLFFNELNEIPHARYFTAPSFSNEYAFSIEKENKKYLIVSITPSESYWRAKNKEKIKFEIQKKEIKKQLYRKIGVLFQILAKQTKNYENEVFKTDGDTYYFITSDNKSKIKIGETWSPNKNSNMGELVSICNNLYEIGRNDQISLDEIDSKIDKLIVELKKD